MNPRTLRRKALRVLKSRLDRVVEEYRRWNIARVIRCVSLDFRFGGL